MIRHFFEFCIAAYDDLLSLVLHPRSNYDLYRKAVELPRADGRYFVWYRTRNAKTEVAPAIMAKERVGSPMEFVGEKHVLSPAEYGDSLAELVVRYPPPTVIISKEK